MERAGFGIRLGAYILDSIILGILSWIISFVVGIAGLRVTQPPVVDPATGMPMFSPEYWRTMSVSLLINLVIWFIYYVVISVLMNGQTIGKKLTRIRIVRLNGERVSWARMFVREFFGKLISTIILFIGFLMALGSSRRALHDYIAGTVVVRLVNDRAA
jgi:uncharacterized RDD family membrane protein YckC